MCGIAGQISPAIEPHKLVEDTRRALGVIRHRGPDQFGIYADPYATLGNARLSIVDLSSGQQPIANEDESLWIVFNGEIFNHVELRPGLEARGHRFRTHCDTEVILHLYEELGPACLDQLNGQFAIAIWDRKRRRLFLARDRLGVRPLFYWRRGERLVFGSEIKALLTHPEIQAELDPVALDQIFSLWSPVSPRTAFRDIQELPPGHYLIAQAGKVELHRYWELTFNEEGNEPREAKWDDCVEQFRELLIDAARLRLRADVPVGAYLSGGLDSSVITSIIRHHTPNQLQTFSIAFSDAEFDESGFQKQMAAFLGTQHHVVTATHQDIGRVFPEVIWHTEIPVMRTSPAPMFLLSKLVHDHGLKVVLTGEGADEFLGGYDIFKEDKIRRFWARQPDSQWRALLLKRLYPEIGGLNRGAGSMLAAFFRAGLSEVDAPDYSHAIRWKNNRRTCRFFSDDFAERAAAGEASPRQAIHFPEAFNRWGALERAQYLEIDNFMSQYLLSSQGDRVGMAHSVEGRFPFLDYRVVAFCCGLPSRFKLRGLREKHLLREAAKPLLPPEIGNRRKRPYRAPIHRSFFRSASPDYLPDLLSPERIRAAGIFNPPAVAQLVTKAQGTGPVGETDDMAIAGIISSQLCWEKFVANFPKVRAVGGPDDVKVCLYPS
ncbi:MAG TPA: asparagine synthase (glutamine-hydrolyzing) [Verrucomicrobiota bacterium]|nr:asparagine synthase (glutamine-hydrolyzing) [Verrucomicrobiota bacterium]